METNKPVLPSQRALEKEKEKSKLAKLKKEKDDKVKTIFNNVAATEEGRELFRYFIELLGFYKRSITLDPTTGEVNKETSFYLEVRKSVWLDMRENILKKHLKKIEFN